MTKLHAVTNTQLGKRIDPGAWRFLIILLMMVMTAVCLMSGAAFAQDTDDDVDEDDRGGRRGVCSQTANLLFRACGTEAQDDFFKAQAICLNVSDDEERKQCYADAATMRNESRQLCGEQRTARRNVCAALGEARYDPDFDPADFDTDFTNPPNLNPYHPVKIGYHWEYEGEGEVIVIDVLNETKLIEGVTCIVVQDRVEKDGELIEDTDDWFAQAKNGDVWYCGEEVKDYESFDGDNPKLPELVSIDGSFKAGREGDKPGILFLGSPTPGAVYRQEFSVNNAEDAVRVLSTTYSFGNNPALDQFVPQQLAQLLCSAGDCVVTSDFTPLDPSPEAVERKYYAKGIGLFFSVHEITGEGVQLANCNFDPRCALLPTP
jgi:hypothetical protein